MKKFKRFNKLTEVKEDFISTSGVLTTMSTSAIPNKGDNGKAYFRFTAELDVVNGTTSVGGQVYEGLVPFLGKLPEPGDKLEFLAKVSDLREGFNGRWGIGGASFDDTQAILDDIANL